MLHREHLSTQTGKKEIRNAGLKLSYRIDLMVSASFDTTAETLS